MQKKHARYLGYILLAMAVAVPGTLLRLTGQYHAVLAGPHAWLVAASAGLAVLGASFLLLWAVDAAQEDISQTLALAIVALIAVLPEYAVDMYVTWQAGHNVAYAPLAVANMTGANRLIIGVAWLAIVGLFWVKTRKAVHIGHDRHTELFFMALASIWALVVALKHALAWYDGLVFASIYVWYMIVAGKRPTTESEAEEGPTELLLALSPLWRRLATVGLFVFAAAVIYANAEPFSEGLIRTGEVLHLDKALLIQWLAPIASEAPEFTVAIMFTLRLKPGMALGSLLSANVNQWTLLVGMIPFVYALSHGSFDHVIPMGDWQMNEILLTAAQSALGIVMLAALRLNVKQALLLFALFVGQLVLPELARHFPNLLPFGLTAESVHPIFSALYLLGVGVLLLRQPGTLKNVVYGALREPAHDEAGADNIKESEKPEG
jgi:cation:H+ antiporter